MEYGMHRLGSVVHSGFSRFLLIIFMYITFDQYEL